MFLHGSVICSISRLSTIPLHGCAVVHLLISSWTLGLFPFSAIIKKTTMHIHTQVLVLTYVFVSLG